MAWRRWPTFLGLLLGLAIPGAGKDRDWYPPWDFGEEVLSIAMVSGAVPLPPPEDGAASLLFIGQDSDEGVSFWRSDGTPEGTLSVGRPWAGTEWAYGISLHGGFGWVATGGGLYRSDGTPEGTSTAIPPGGPLHPYGPIGSVAGRILFPAREGESEVAALYAQDLSGGAQLPLRTDRAPRPGAWGWDLNSIPLGGGLLFPGWTQENGWELWRTDGTEEGTRMVRDMAPGPADSLTGDFWLLQYTRGRHEVLRGRLYFMARTEETGREPWVSDGTEEGTRLLADLAPGSGDSWPTILGETPGGILVAGMRPEIGSALWSVRGPGEEARLLRVLHPGTVLYPGITPIGQLGEAFLFLHSQSALDTLELWRTDGTPEGTELVRLLEVGGTRNWTSGFFHPLPGTGSAVFDTVGNSEFGPGMWRTDGTEAGTEALRVEAIFPLFWRGTIYFSGWGPWALLRATPAGLGLSSSLIDDDGDGFSTELEIALDSPWWDGGATPLGPGGGGPPREFTVRAASFALDGWKPAADRLTLEGTLPVPADFEAAGASVVLDGGGVLRTLTLDARGRARSGEDDFRLHLRRRRGAVLEDPAAPFRLRLRRASLMGALYDEGVWEPEVVENAPLSLPVTVLFDGRRHRSEVPLLWTVRRYGTGRARLDR